MSNITCTIDIKVHCYSTINEMHCEVSPSCCTAGTVLEPLSRAADFRIIAFMHHKLRYNLQVKIDSFLASAVSHNRVRKAEPENV